MYMLFLASSVSFADDGYVEKPVRPDDLYEVIESANRVVVTDFTRDGDKVLYDSMDIKDLIALRESLEVIVPDGYQYCACIGSPAVHLYEGEIRLLSFTNHHGLAVRTPLWSSDAPVADPDKWVNWFAKLGITGPKEELDKMRIMEKEWEEDLSRWMNVMPESLKPIWSEALDAYGEVDTNRLDEALKKEMPEQDERILALLEWYGSGSGPWSGFPSYETAPEEMIQEYKTVDIVNVIEFNELNPSQKEGAARFFAGRKRRNELDQLPDGLKGELLEHVMQSDNEDNKARAKYAFE